MRRMLVVWLLAAASVAALTFTGCRGCARAAHGEPACDSSAATALQGEKRPAARAALDRASAYLETVNADPVALRARGLKGKKHYVEMLGALARLHQVADNQQIAPLYARIRAHASHAFRPAYHDMLDTTDAAFKQDATSYLRAAWLLQRFGVALDDYGAHIKAIKPRLDAHLPGRGVNQKMTFASYYAHFGLQQPFDLGAAYEGGVIRSRLAPDKLSLLHRYHLTHEVFILYDFGYALDRDPFNDDDKAYLRAVLPQLAHAARADGNVDLLAELLMCMTMVGIVDVPIYVEGFDVLLKSQHEDGSFGDRDRAARHGENAPVLAYLHTTAVVIDALALGFYSPVPRAWCGGDPVPDRQRFVPVEDEDE